MNKVILLGRLTADPKGNETYQRFTLAVPRKKSREAEGQDTDFIPCVAFSKTGEFIAKYGKQGLKLAIEGRIQTGSYTNKDGQKVYTTDVVVESAEFVEKKAETKEAPPASNNEFMDIPEGIENDLPFK